MRERIYYMMVSGYEVIDSLDDPLRNLINTALALYSNVLALLGVEVADRLSLVMVDLESLTSRLLIVISSTGNLSSLEDAADELLLTYL